jgi:hypothetical protein
VTAERTFDVDPDGVTTLGHAHSVAHGPEAQLFLAVIVQAVRDAPKQNVYGITAREFLDDAHVQAMAQFLWRTSIRSTLDPRGARRAIVSYRMSEGKVGGRG